MVPAENNGISRKKRTTWPEAWPNRSRRGAGRCVAEERNGQKKGIWSVLVVFFKPLSKKLRNPLDQEQIMRKDNTSDISPITSFREQHFFLSNFYGCTINFEGITYPSTEHAYQAAKSVIIAERQLICRQTSAGNAKRAGRRITIRRDWNDVKLAKMEAILRLKFSVTQPELVQKLTATHPRILREENYWHDTFWGICNGAGSNHLGKLLMKIRADLQMD